MSGPDRRCSGMMGRGKGAGGAAWHTMESGCRPLHTRERVRWILKGGARRKTWQRGRLARSRAGFPSPSIDACRAMTPHERAHEPSPTIHHRRRQTHPLSIQGPSVTWMVGYIVCTAIAITWAAVCRVRSKRSLLSFVGSSRTESDEAAAPPLEAASAAEEEVRRRHSGGWRRRPARAASVASIPRVVGCGV